MRRFAATVLSCLVLAGTVSAQARKEAVDGIRNFTVVDATVACAGATETRVFPALKERGYKTVLNLREATETGAAINESRAMATAAGLKFIHLPLDPAAPDDLVVDEFLKIVTEPANQPVFINCGSANRVSALWLTKRILVDKWEEAAALEEAKIIGLTSEPLKKFALAYVAKKKK